MSEHRNSVLRSIHFAAMGTRCAIHVHAHRKLIVPTARAAIAEVNRIEAKYSRYLPVSFLSEINRCAAAGGALSVDEETAALLDYAERCYQLSEGLFDITSGAFRRVWDFRSGRIPDLSEIDKILPLVGFGKLSWQKPLLSFPFAGMEIDFGGIAKEYAADRAAAICRSAEIASALVDLGGDIAIVGSQPGGEPWHIGISDPQQPDRAFARIFLCAGGLASSGNYARYIIIGGKRFSHIVNPLTGWPIDEVTTVSVSADQCLVAGSFSTIAMLMGRRGIAWLQRLGVAHAWMDASSANGCIPPFELVIQQEPVKQAY
jgi:FAD:protein FMN transferase